MHKENREEIHVPRTYNAQKLASSHPPWEGSPSTLGLLASPGHGDAVTVPEGPRGHSRPGPAGPPPRGDSPSLTASHGPCSWRPLPPGQAASSPPPLLLPRGGNGVPSGFGGGGRVRAEGGAPSPRPAGPRTHPPAVG